MSFYDEQDAFSAPQSDAAGQGDGSYAPPTQFAPTAAVARPATLPKPPSGSPFATAPEPAVETSTFATGERFPFDTVFQLKTLAILLREPAFMMDWAEIIKTSYFDNPDQRYLADLMFKTYRSLRQPPSYLIMRSEVVAECDRMQHPDSIRMTLLSLLDEMRDVSLEESRYIVKRVTDFCKVSAARELALDLVQTVQKAERDGEADFDKIAPKIRKLGSIGIPGGRGTIFKEGISSLKARLESSATYGGHTKVPTGIAKIDHILDGGVSAGEIAFIAAGSGVGKSSLLAQFAANAMKAKCNVMIFTMELKEDDYELRLHQHLTGVGKRHVRSGSMRYQQRLNRIYEVTSGSELVIKYYPPGTANTDMMRSFFSRVKAERDNGRPWLIVIDYIDQMRMGDPEKVQTWELIGRVVDELIAFGWECGAPIWTASQINRAGHAKVMNGGGKKHSGKEDIGASWKKVEKADLLLMFDQSTEEKVQGTARIRVEKCRRGRDGFSIIVRDERPLMTFIEIDNDGNPVNGYSPTQSKSNVSTGYPDDWLDLHPDWDQETEFPDEGPDAYLQTPRAEVNQYLAELYATHKREDEGVDMEQIGRELEAKMGGGSFSQQVNQAVALPPRPAAIGGPADHFSPGFGPGSVQ